MEFITFITNYINDLADKSDHIHVDFEEKLWTYFDEAYEELLKIYPDAKHFNKQDLYTNVFIYNIDKD